MTEEDTRAGGKQSLCRKYDIMDNQLDFAYVNTCKDPKTLEKILKVLRSKEEGDYPELEKKTEDRLKELCPNSRLLFKEQQVCHLEQLPKEEQEEISKEFLEWGSVNDGQPVEGTNKVVERFKEYPAVRNSNKMLIEKSAVNKNQSKSCVPRSYDSWNKFDVDKELSLIDRQEELQVNELIRSSNEPKNHQDLPEEQIQVGEIGAGDACSEKYAIEEKRKGNDCFKAKEYMDALRHYNKSIQISPLPEVFNNRAQVYLYLNKFEQAIADCDKVLQMNKQDVKAYYRKSKALMGLDRLREAYESIEKAVKFDPNDKSVQELANKIREMLNLHHPSSKKVRMAIQEVGETRKLEPFIEEISSRDIYYPFSRSADNIPLNDIGTARHMCRCNGSVPPFIAKLRSFEDTPHANRLYLRKTRSKKSSNDKSLSNRRSKKLSGSPNGEIIEKDTIEAVEKVVCKNDTLPTNTTKSNLVYCLSKKDLTGIASEMATLHSSQISEALSDRLDSTTLNLCVKALCSHLKPSMESSAQWKVVQENLVALSHLPKFRSAVKSLDASSKKALMATVAKAEAEGQRVADVLTLYELQTVPYPMKAP